MRVGPAAILILLVTALAPIPSAVAPADLSGLLIAVDPGHGGNDPGAQGFGLDEADAVLDIALRLRDLLEADGADVLMTRTTDATVSLDARTDLANDNGADRFVSIHANACGACGGHGTETYYHDSLTPQSTSARLADVVQEEVIDLLGTRDRGVKTANFHVLRETNMPAILVETAFVDEEGDNALLASPARRADFAEALLFGVQRHFGVPVHVPGIDVSPPTISITAPDLDAWHRGDVTVRADITDASGLQFARARLDGGAWKWDSVAPHAWPWTVAELADGQHALEVQAEDGVSNRGSIHGTLRIDNTLPTVEITDPQDGDVLLLGATVRVDAEDAASGIDRVEFYVDGELREVDEDAPYEWSWGALFEPFFHTIEVRGFDLAGNEAGNAVDVLVV